MTRYYFDLKDGNRMRDHDGLEFATDAEAESYAQTMSIALAKDRLVPVDAAPLFVSIVHQDGREVAQVPVRNLRIVE